MIITIFTYYRLVKHIITKKNIMAKLVNSLGSSTSPLSRAALDKFRVVS